MKINTNELTGAALDWAVAKCEGATDLEFDGVTWGFKLGGKLRVLARGWAESMTFLPSSNWAQGGPIIEREKIGVTFHDERDDWEVPNWGAWPTQTDDRQEIMGETPLIAAMRCYVASRLSDEVEVPVELLGETK